MAQTVEFPPSKQQEFTVTAAAMGLSLSQILTLLALILGTQVRPGRGTLGRWVQAAGIAAGRVLKHLDRQCRALVLVGCLDEIFFHGRPVLVGVEPASMTWFLGHKADDRTGATWCQHLQTWTSLEYVLADAGTGLQAGIASVQQQRRDGPHTPLENGLDVFHTLREGERALSQAWAQVETLWGEAEAADRRVEQARGVLLGLGSRGKGSQERLIASRKVPATAGGGGAPFGLGGPPPPAGTNLPREAYYYVHRNGDCGSPRVVGSMRASRSRINVASFSFRG